MEPIRDVWEMRKSLRGMAKRKLKTLLRAELKGPRRKYVVERILNEIARREREERRVLIASITPKQGFHAGAGL